MPHDKAMAPINLSTSKSRAALARLLTNLFAKGGLFPTEQANLLGLPSSRKTLVAKYRRGSPLANTKGMLDRAGWVLSIHKALRLLYPYNENLRYSWVKRRNRNFENFTPAEVMMREGIISIAKVSRYLDIELGIDQADRQNVELLL